jgi:hypothetical protein
MAEILSTELKDDLEDIYKKTGDLLSLLESKSFENESSEVHELVELVKFRLQDITGTLQKDIYNCDYLITKIKTVYGKDFIEKHTKN